MAKQTDSKTNVENLGKMPRLRFPEFQGKWDERTLGEIGDVKMCRRIFNEETSPIGEIPFYKIGSFGKDADAYISKELYLDYKERFPFPKKGDILISAAGTIGRTVIYNGEDAYYQDSNIVWIDNDNSIISNEFLFYILQIVKFNTEGGTIQRLYNNILKSTKFRNPSLIEQKKIASLLSLIDERMQHQMKIIEGLTSFKSAVSKKIFSQELRFKDENGEYFPDWEIVQIKDIFKITRGNVLSMLLVSKEKTHDYQYPVFSSQTQNNGLAGFYNNFLFENAITWTTDGAGAGDVNYRSGKFYCTNVCGVLINQEGYANQFIAEMINSVSRKYVSYVGNPKLMNNVMSEIPIKIPMSMKEQQKISSFLVTLNQKIDLETALLQQLKLQMQYLLQQLFI
jgi:type I restriction enzyme S subunit